MTTKLAKEAVVRFAVGDESARSSSWRVWANRGKKDVYITARELKGTLKVSLHESGRWHTSFSDAFLAEQQEAGVENLPEQYNHKWPQPPEIAPRLTLALRIVVSAAAATSRSGSPPDHTVLIQRPPEPQAIEVTIFLDSLQRENGWWPGKHTMGTTVVGSLELDGGSTIWIVSRTEPQGVPPMKHNISLDQLVRFKSLNDPSPETTYGSLVFCDEADGSRSIFEMVVNEEVVQALNVAHKN